jgi:hypothetical protein
MGMDNFNAEMKLNLVIAENRNVMDLLERKFLEMEPSL